MEQDVGGRRIILFEEQHDCSKGSTFGGTSQLVEECCMGVRKLDGPGEDGISVKQCIKLRNNVIVDGDIGFV